MTQKVKLLSEEEQRRLSELYQPISHEEVLQLVAIARWAAQAQKWLVERGRHSLLCSYQLARPESCDCGVHALLSVIEEPSSK